jgi:hypothetical protein
MHTFKGIGSKGYRDAGPCGTAVCCSLSQIFILAEGDALGLRRFMIGVVLVLLIGVSVSIGVIVARWPHL